MMSTLNQSLLKNGLAPRSTARVVRTHHTSSAALTGANFIFGGASMHKYAVHFVNGGWKFIKALSPDHARRTVSALQPKREISFVMYIC